MVATYGKISRDFFGGFEFLAEFIESLVGNGATTLIRVDGAEGEVLGGDTHVGQHVEEGRFTDVGETNNTHLEMVTGTAQQDLRCFLCSLLAHAAWYNKQKDFLPNPDNSLPPMNLFIVIKFGF